MNCPLRCAGKSYNGGISGPNIASVQTNNLQAGYLSGTTGALMTQSNKIAFVTAKKFRAMDQLGLLHSGMTLGHST
ncbi:MAG: hypothetical protein ACFB5Z_12420 [Elainellaceae cyanobacterium]